MGMWIAARIYINDSMGTTWNNQENIGPWIRIQGRNISGSENLVDPYGNLPHWVSQIVYTSNMSNII